MTIEAFIDVYENKGFLAAVAVCVTIAVRVYRHPDVQSVLPAQWQWKHLRLWQQWAIIGASALTASLLTAVSTGATLASAIAGAVPVAVTAVCAHKATKALGHAHTGRMQCSQGLTYEPGSIRSALDVVFPVDRRRIEAARQVVHSAARAEQKASRRDT